MIKSLKKDLFYDQSIQESIALYFQMPIRSLNVVDEDVLFKHCKKINFFNLCYKSKDKWLQDSAKIIEELPSFVDKIEQSSQIKFKNHIDTKQLKNLYNLLYHTKSNMHPFFYKKLKENLALWSLSILHSIRIIVFMKQQKEGQFFEFSFLDFNFKAKLIREKILLIGPIMLNSSFKEEEDFISYIKNLKHYFHINLHTYELVNLLNHRTTLTKDSFNTKCEKIANTYKYTDLPEDSSDFRKLQIRQLSTYFIYLQHTSRKKISKASIENFVTFLQTPKADELMDEIKINRSKRELESLEWFSDRSFKRFSFDFTSLDEFSTSALNYLKIKLQADLYFFIRYFNHDNSYSLLEHEGLTDNQNSQINTILQKMNKDQSILEKTVSFQMINDYYHDQKPINLVDDFDKFGYIQMFKNRPKIKSLLSIPLIFDQQVFAIVHFLGFRTFQFDTIDKQFLLKHSSIISRHYMEMIVDSSLTDILELLENLGVNENHGDDDFDKKVDRICEDITKIFVCDGVLLWINKKEVYKTDRKLDELSLTSQFNFLEKGEEKKEYTLGEKAEELLRDKSKVSIVLDVKSKSNLKYQKEFLQKGISSFMAIPILNRSNALTGVLMIFDKSNRQYNELCQSILKRVSLHIGSILNTVSAIQYKTQQLNEENLHESFQYLNIINSRTSDLENRLKDVVFPVSYEKHRIYKNIEDIKDYTNYSKRFLHKLIDPNKQVRKYDQVLQEDKDEILKNRLYIKLNDSVIQVLIAHEKRMFNTNKIRYENNIKYKISVKLPKQQLQDVLNNIINNAIKYTKPQTTIKVYDEKTAQYYNLFIENIGYKIFPDERSFIFKKGSRGKIVKGELAHKDAFKKRDFENQGVGLYNAKFISKVWLGNVKLEQSKPILNSNFCENVFSIKFPIEIIK